jgi:hypothetical protein
MPAQAICCGECSMPIPAESWNRGGTRCRGCGQLVQVAVFPAIESTRIGALPEAIEIETEASCFYHPSSRAAVPCDECGRFLCRLCEIEINGRHLCPTCFETGASANKLNVETSRTMYDSIALALATLPTILFWPALIASPAAIFIAIRRWRAPGSIVPRTRVRYYLALLFALLGLGLMGALIAAMIIGIRASSAAPPRGPMVPF